jgi:hypothetical protein
MATVRVVNRKWDGTVSAVDSARPLAVPRDISAWLVLAGSRRECPVRRLQNPRDPAVVGDTGLEPVTSAV